MYYNYVVPVSWYQYVYSCFGDLKCKTLNLPNEETKTFFSKFDKCVSILLHFIMHLLSIQCTFWNTENSKISTILRNLPFCNNLYYILKQIFINYISLLLYMYLYRTTFSLMFGFFLLTKSILSKISTIEHNNIDKCCRMKIKNCIYNSFKIDINSHFNLNHLDHPWFPMLNVNASLFQTKSCDFYFILIAFASFY